jgi:hypothetical protein
MVHKVEIIEKSNREEFKTLVGGFYSTHHVVECKFQRNLYYKGVGSSDGYDGDKSKVDAVAKGCVELEESWVAILVYSE